MLVCYLLKLPQVQLNSTSTKSNLNSNLKYLSKIKDNYFSKVFSFLVFDHDIKDRAFLCDICPKTMLPTKATYKKHVKDKTQSFRMVLDSIFLYLIREFSPL